MRYAASLALVQPPKFLSSFGRNRGRSLRPYQQGLVDELLPKIGITLTSPLGEVGALLGVAGEGMGRVGIVSPHPKSVGAHLDLSQGRSFNALALEIGFGGGEHLLAQAAHNPDTLFIGCEPFINGVAKCLAGIDAQKLTNIRLFTRDAREIIEALPDACLDSVFILFPDPWPKLRHNKRRLVNAKTLSMLARTHKKGGRLLLATDHVDYSVWMLEVLQNHPDYQWTAKEKADWNNQPSDWTETKYQRKTSAEGREPVFMECVRR
jgi:tRNA (guanine-N7-)-methyltransferase